MQHVGFAVAAPGLSSTGSAVVVHGLSCSVACGIFLDRDQTRVSCVGRWILYHWATREAPINAFWLTDGTWMRLGFSQCVIPTSSYVLSLFGLWWYKKLLSHDKSAPLAERFLEQKNSEIPICQFHKLEHKPKFSIFKIIGYDCFRRGISSFSMALFPLLLGRADLGWVLELAQVAGRYWIEKWVLVW